jgi:hypothetical protein
VDTSNFSIGLNKIWLQITNSSGCITTDTINITFSNNVGLEKKYSETIYLFPNPSTGMIKITGLNDLNSLIYISDINGKILKKELLQNETLNLEELAKGIYFISFYLEGKRIIKKVILE